MPEICILDFPRPKPHFATGRAISQIISRAREFISSAIPLVRVYILERRQSLAEDKVATNSSLVINSSRYPALISAQENLIFFFLFHRWRDAVYRRVPSLAGMTNATEFTNLTSSSGARDPIKKSNWLSSSFISWTNETRFAIGSSARRWSRENIAQRIEPPNDNNNKTWGRLWIISAFTIYIDRMKIK